MKKFISFSGGVESRTMALVYGGQADAIFADTGYEHQALYAQLDEVEQKIRQWHHNDFKIHHIQAKNVEGTGTNTLPEYIRYRKYYPSIGRRYCTWLFKIKPIDNFLKQYEAEGVVLMIGLNADEADMRTGNYGLLPFVEYTYPLLDNGISRSKCEEMLEAAGIAPHFPAYMRRGGCKGCYFKQKREYAAMAILAPKEYDEVAAIEQDIQDERDNFFHILPNVRSLKDFKPQAQSVLFDADEIYPAVVNNVTKCGVFCNR